MRILDLVAVIAVVGIVFSALIGRPEDDRVSKTSPDTTQTPRQEALPELRLEVVGKPRNPDDLVFRITLKSQQAFRLGISNGTPVAGFAVESPERRWNPVPSGPTDRTIETEHCVWEIRWADFDEDHSTGLNEAVRRDHVVAEVETMIYSVHTGQPRLLSSWVKVPQFPVATSEKAPEPVGTGLKVKRILSDGSSTEDTTVRF